MVKILLYQTYMFFLIVAVYILDVPRLINIPFNYVQSKLIDINNELDDKVGLLRNKHIPKKEDLIIDL